MSTRPAPPGRVPTLTEVVRIPETGAAAGTPASSTAIARPEPAPLQNLPRKPAGSPDEEELTERVLADLQRQIDLMLEVKLREVLTPALTRATDALMREARNELASTLRDVVSRIVAQELARHRGR
ncbi:hypothetical protein [uncultured Piscinibacter sp.]|uniref:hypothetical protein n=1 Tax=uncultured Piscinibacter sp. TaxID=1131835 RepID=UPI00262EB30D|nr:hypothetical protein [uncultured Piscinibacter sp.]